MLIFTNVTPGLLGIALMKRPKGHKCRSYVPTVGYYGNVVRSTYVTEEPDHTVGVQLQYQKTV
jgi:hypothetical protein